MQEELDKLYDEYLKEKLDLIFVMDRRQRPSKIYKKEVEEYKDEMPSIRKEEDGEYLIDSHGNRISEYYDYIIDEYKDGYFLVKKDKKYNFINKRGEELLKKGYDEAESFSDGLALVVKKEKDTFFGGKYNYITTDGKLLLHNWGNDGRSFSEGIARIEGKDYCWQYIDTDGNVIASGFRQAKDFYNGYALVEKDDEYNFIDKNGNPRYKPGFKDVTIDAYKYYVISNGTKWNIADPKGELLFDWMDEVGKYSIFDDGDYFLKLNNKKNYFDSRRGRLLSNKWYDSINRDYNDHFIIAENNGKYAFIDYDTGYVIDNKWYELIEYHHKCCIIKDNGKYNIVGMDLKPMCDAWYRNIESCGSRFIVTREDGKKNLVDKTGHLICDEWYDIIEVVYDNYKVMKKQHGIKRWTCIDANGNHIFKDWSTIKPRCISSTGRESTIRCGLKQVFISSEPRYYGDYKIEKKDSEYYCISPSDVFAIKYKPIHIYGNRYVICNDKESIYLYDREKDKYERLDKYTEFNVGNYTRNYIFEGGSPKYLMYDNKMIDVFDYYDNNIRYRDYHINYGVKILSKEEFLKGNEEEIKERYKAGIEEIKEYRKKQQEEEEAKRIEALVKKQEQQENELKSIRESELERLQNTITILEDCENRLGIVNENRFTISNNPIDCGDHKELNPLCFKVGFKRVDLSSISLKNLRLRGLDLHEANISIGENDLQEIENMDLTDTNLEGNYLLPRTKLDGVIVRGARFSIDKNPKTMDINVEAFKNAIYDDKTTINGVPLVELLEKEKQYSK